MATDAQRDFDVQAWLRRHADIAEPLSQFIENQAVFDLGLHHSTVAEKAQSVTPEFDGDRQQYGLEMPISRDTLGQYELLREIGRGGMGIVYAARHKQLGREVALKVMRGYFLDSDSESRRFQRECEAIARLDHRAIIPIYEVGTWQGSAFFTMKLVPGGTLRDWMDIEDGHSIHDIVRCLIEVSAALQHAHDRGVLHRDLKPANILIDEHEHPFVADFGLAKHFDSVETTTGRMLGTPAYMAPEQVLGTSTIASEVYAIGAILYALLTKRPPFLGTTFADQIQQLEACSLVSPRQLNSQVPRDLETICLKCLRKAPADRYRSAAAVHADLCAFLENRPIRARPVSKVETMVKVVQRNAAASLAYLLLLLVVVGGSGAIIVQRDQFRRTEHARLKQLEATGLAATIATADPAELISLLDWPPADSARVVAALQDQRRYLAQALAEGVLTQEREQAQRLNIALALIAVDPTQGDVVWPSLLAASPEQVHVIGKVLSRSVADFPQLCHQSLANEEVNAAGKLRLAAALSTTRGRFAVSQEVAGTIVSQLLEMPPIDFADWSGLLQPLLEELSDQLRIVLERDDATQQQRFYAIDLLTQAMGGQPDKMFELLLRAQPAEFALVKKRLGVAEESVLELAEACVMAPPEAGPSDELELQRRSRAIALLAHHNRLEFTVEPFSAIADPQLGSRLVHDFSAYGVPASRVWYFTLAQDDTAVRFGLLSCLAEYAQEQWPGDVLDEAQPVLQAWYRDDPDPGIHAICGLLLSRWNRMDEDIDGLVASSTADDLERRWFINGQKQTFVIVDGGTCLMGSPESETDRDYDEQQHLRRVERRYAIGATEVMRGDFLKFQPDLPWVGRGDPQELKRPVAGIDWYSAANYCNWLSEQERIPPDQWCYEPNEDGQYAAGMTIVADSLNRNGYRLPTEAEWEFACRAGAMTSRHYGESESMLPHYAWYSPFARDRSHPVGRLLPNRLGLFDSLGNVYEWCHDVYRPYPEPLVNGELASSFDDALPKQITNDTQRRGLRGGSFDYSARHSRSAYRTNDLLDFVVSNDGFRLARTWP